MLTLLLPLLAACDNKMEPVDEDGDGFAIVDGDCDDADASVNPEASEACNEVDDNCDGEIDEGAGATFYADADEDGFGDPGSASSGCDAPDGTVADGTDCDDSDGSIHPDAEELCDEVDSDCDGDLADAGEMVTWYPDADADGWGADEGTVTACTQPEGFAEYGGDCNDEDPAFHPSAEESDCEDPNDYNCDGSVGYSDGDGDGFAACEECDDGNAVINPDGVEVCDDLDDDCDGSVDEEATDAATWYMDLDGDGFGDAAMPLAACDAPAGYVADATDCDDATSTTFPGAEELCDSVDNDCDGNVDEDGGDAATWYADTDGDGYGDPGVSTASCSQPAGYIADATDCDDADAATFPGATELCDGLDNNCDGTVDEDTASDGATFYADSDGDGFGDAASSTTACAAPPGYGTDATDCDDTDASVNPDGTEVCDGLDNNCDGATDEETAADAGSWYMDADADGYGDGSVSVVACDAPIGYVGSSDDCDDGDASLNPSASEVCDGADNDCDGATDGATAVDASTWYADGDGDGYGDPGTSRVECSAPAGYVASATDCDDSSASAMPGGTEVCDGLDNDCDGSTDETGSSGAATWYADADGDGYGAAGSSTVECTQPSGYVADSSDCNDGSASVSPGADELCADGIDNDCDGDTDDGSATDATDWYADVDGDGYGDVASIVSACSAPSGYIATATDCDDSDSGITDVWFESDFSTTPEDLYLNGTGPTGTSWEPYVSSGELLLTPAANSRAGTAVYGTRIPADHWYASFDFAVYGGSGTAGGDGLTFFFVDETDTSILGSTGSMMGIAGYNSSGTENGYAVEVDTYVNVNDPGGVDHIALQDVNSWSYLDYAASGELSGTTATWHALDIEMNDGTVEVWLDGTFLFDYTISGYGTSDGNVLVGWSAGTGGRNNIQSIDNAVIGCP